MDMQIRGAKEIERALLALPKKLAKKGVRRSVRKGGNIFLKAAKGNAANQVGGELGAALVKAMQLRAYRKHRKGTFAMRVLINPGAPDFVYETKGMGSRYQGANKKVAEHTRHYIPAAVEFGHRFPYGMKPGFVPPVPFMRPAFDERGAAALNTVTTSLWKEVKLAAKARG